MILSFSSEFYSQETENYKSLASQIKPISNETFVEFYKNGKIKREGTRTTYYFINGDEYGVYSGTYTEYLKNGKKLAERINNMFGSPLSSKTYINGNLFSETKTIELDTNSKTVDSFLKDNKNVSIKYEYIEYIIENNEPVIRKKGIKVNDKKSGI